MQNNVNSRAFPGDLGVFDGPCGKRSGGRTGQTTGRTGHAIGRTPAPIHQGAPSSETDAAPDETLLAGFRDGDPERAEAFVRRFQRRVYGLAVTMTGDRVWADDIAQDAFLRAWRGASSFDPTRGSVTTWLLTITRSAALDALRRHRPDSVSPHAEAFAQIVSTDPLPADVAALENEMVAVRSALTRVPFEQRKAVVLASLFRLTAAEIAEAEGIPLGTAKTRIRSGMLKMRAELQVTEHARLVDAGGWPRGTVPT